MDIDYINEPLVLEYAKRNDINFTMDTPHTHNCYELYYLAEGERKYFIHDRTYLVKEGSVVLIPPHVIHKALNSQSPYHERYLLYIDRNSLQGVFDQLDPMDWMTAFDVKHPVIALEPRARRSIDDLIQVLMDLNEQDSPIDRNLFKLKVLELLIGISQYSEIHKKRAQERKTGESEREERVFAAVWYINHHFGSHLTLNQVAEKLYISPYYLSRHFRAVTGFGFAQYLNQVRILEAEKQLLTTNKTILDIALAVGFESSTHFGRVFKASKGITAREYRKRYK